MNTKLGAMLREARKAKGLTLMQVDEAAGVSYAYLSQVETGVVQRPGVGWLRKIAPAYGLDPDDLVDAAYPAIPKAATDPASPRTLTDDEVVEVGLRLLHSTEYLGPFLERWYGIEPTLVNTSRTIDRLKASGFRRCTFCDAWVRDDRAPVAPCVDCEESKPAPQPIQGD